MSDHSLSSGSTSSYLSEQGKKVYEKYTRILAKSSPATAVLEEGEKVIPVEVTENDASVKSVDAHDASAIKSVVPVSTEKIEAKSGSEDAVKTKSIDSFNLPQQQDKNSNLAQSSSNNAVEKSSDLPTKAESGEGSKVKSDPEENNAPVAPSSSEGTQVEKESDTAAEPLKIPGSDELKDLAERKVAIDSGITTPGVEKGKLKTLPISVKLDDNDVKEKSPSSKAVAATAVGAAVVGAVTAKVLGSSDSDEPAALEPVIVPVDEKPAVTDLKNALEPITTESTKSPSEPKDDKFSEDKEIPDSALKVSNQYSGTPPKTASIPTITEDDNKGSEPNNSIEPITTKAPVKETEEKVEEESWTLKKAGAVSKAPVKTTSIPVTKNDEKEGSDLKEASPVVEDKVEAVEDKLPSIVLPKVTSKIVEKAEVIDSFEFEEPHESEVPKKPEKVAPLSAATTPAFIQPVAPAITAHNSGEPEDQAPIGLSVGHLEESENAAKAEIESAIEEEERVDFSVVSQALSAPIEENVSLEKKIRVDELGEKPLGAAPVVGVETPDTPPEIKPVSTTLKDAGTELKVEEGVTEDKPPLAPTTTPQANAVSSLPERELEEPKKPQLQATTTPQETPALVSASDASPPLQQETEFTEPAANITSASPPAGATPAGAAPAGTTLAGAAVAGAAVAGAQTGISQVAPEQITPTPQYKPAVAQKKVKEKSGNKVLLWLLIVILLLLIVGSVLAMTVFKEALQNAIGGAAAPEEEALVVDPIPASATESKVMTESWESPVVDVSPQPITAEPAAEEVGSQDVAPLVLPSEDLGQKTELQELGAIGILGNFDY